MECFLGYLLLKFCGCFHCIKKKYFISLFYKSLLFRIPYFCLVSQSFYNLTLVSSIVENLSAHQFSLCQPCNHFITLFYLKEHHQDYLLKLMHIFDPTFYIFCFFCCLFVFLFFCFSYLGQKSWIASLRYLPLSPLFLSFSYILP